MVTPYADVDTPPLVPWRYGLLDAATVITDPEAHWQLGIQYDSQACATGGIWDLRCADPFTVVLTRTATANQFSVNFTPDVGPYEASIDGGAFAPMLDGAIFVETTSPFTAVFRETGGLGRSVTITGITPGSTQGTQFNGASSSAAANDPKTADGLSVITGDPFAVYSGIDCRIVGLNNAPGIATQRLVAVEQRLVEQHVWQQQLAVPTAQFATGSATAVPLKAGVAALERVLGDNYGGIGVIHSPDWLSVYLADRQQLVADGRVIRTHLGTAYAFGRGYLNTAPDGAPAAAGEAWLYASGAVVARRSDLVIPATPLTGATNLSINDALVIAERTYVVTLDCPLFAVHVTLTGEDPA